MNTGRVLAKVGVNEKINEPEKTPVSFVVIDNGCHLTDNGVLYLSKKLKQLFIVTTSKSHPAFKLQKENSNIEILFYEDNIIFVDLMERLRGNFNVEGLTIQSGGTLNAVLLRAGLVDRVLIVVAPALIGGKDTATLVDGESLHSQEDLSKIRTLKLIEAKPLKDSYLLLEYSVKN